MNNVVTNRTSISGNESIIVPDYNQFQRLSQKESPNITEIDSNYKY